MSAAVPLDARVVAGSDAAAAVELSGLEQARLVRSLLSTLAAGGAAPQHVETHISHVVLCGGHAYKIKKVLAMPFLDQSTLAQRRWACAEELRLNRRTAPQLYLDVVPITGMVDAPVLGGGGPLLEVAVRMRRFDENGLWDRLAARGALREDDIDDLAAALARLHAEAEVAPPDAWFGTPAQVRPALLDSLRDLEGGPCGGGWPDPAGRRALAHLRQWEGETFPRLGPAMLRRLAAGRVREGHGDLHLGNVTREAGHSLAFDGIEFDAGLRWTDVMSDVAFMTMDLQAHGLHPLAHRFTDAYLKLTGDYDGLGVFGYYLVHRALVRAKVETLRAAQIANGLPPAAQKAARRYLDLAVALTIPRRRALLITHGLSGSGKTTLTQDLLQAIGAPCVRSDVERKRLAGLEPLQRSRSTLAAGLYGPEMNEATLRRLLDAATSVLEGGWPVILDATFLRRRARDAARRCASELGVPFVILDFDVPLATLRERVHRRAEEARDASEADEAVLAMQARTQEPLEPDEMAAVHRVQAGVEPGGPPRVDWAVLLASLRVAPRAATVDS